MNLKNVLRVFLALVAVWHLGWAVAGTPVVAAGSGQSFAIDTQGRLFGWGDDRYGQLGLGRMTRSLVPLKVGSDFKITTAGGGDRWVATGRFVYRSTQDRWHTLGLGSERFGTTRHR